MNEVQLPSSFYYCIGAFIFINLGAIGTIIVTALKVSWWVSEWKTKVEGRLDRNEKDISAAHDKIRQANPPSFSSEPF